MKRRRSTASRQLNSAPSLKRRSNVPAHSRLNMSVRCGHELSRPVQTGSYERSENLGSEAQKSAGSHTNVTTRVRSEEHTSELQSRLHLVCRLLLEKKNQKMNH